MNEEENITSETEPVETKRSSMVYVVSGILLLLVAGGGFFLMSKQNSKPPMATPEVQGISASRPQRPSLKGQNFSDTQFAESAYQIYPGTISEAAKAAMSGWDLKTVKNPDGTTTASLIPVGSEVSEGDTSHTYILQPSDKLYFADLNPGDDNRGSTDNNKNDDMGIVVDASGIIQ